MPTLKGISQSVMYFVTHWRKECKRKMVIVRLLRYTFSVIARNVFSRQGSLERLDFYKIGIASFRSPRQQNDIFTVFLKKGASGQRGGENF
jgi:hypothetical protein